MFPAAEAVTLTKHRLRIQVEAPSLCGLALDPVSFLSGSLLGLLEDYTRHSTPDYSYGDRRLWRQRDGGDVKRRTRGGNRQGFHIMA